MHQRASETKTGVRLIFRAETSTTAGIAMNAE